MIVTLHRSLELRLMQRLMHHKKITKLPNLEIVGSTIVIRRVTGPITTGKNQDKPIQI